MSRKSGFWNSASAFALMCGAACLSTGAYAQTEDRANAMPPLAAETVVPAQGAASPSGKVETIVVTAQRRNVDLQKTSIAATVLTAEDLTNKSVFGLEAIQFAAPSVTINKNGGANVFNIRGIGRERVDVEIPSGIVIYRDGVPTIAGYFQNEPYFDMAGIEVLRGPQGTLAGKSASGGALFIRSASPDLDGFSGFAQAGIGNFARREATVAVNVPLDDTLAVRVAYHHFQRDPWYDLTGPYTGHPDRRDYDAARIGVLWQPIDALEVLWKTDVSHLDFGGDVTSSYLTPLFDVHQDAPFTAKDKSVRSVLNIKYRFGDGTTFNSVTGTQIGFTKFANDLNGAVVTPSYWFRAQGNFYLYSQEFTLISPENQAFRWILGLFGQRQLNSIPDFLTSGKLGLTFTGGPFFPNMAFPWLQSPWRMVEDDLAVFGTIEYDLTPELVTEVGARFSYNHRDQYTALSFGDGSFPPFLNFDLVPLAFLDPAGGSNDKATGNYLDYKVALNWKPTDDDFFYVLHALGHTTKAINIFPPHPQYGRVEVFDYEAGWKGTLFDGRVRTQVDVYYENIANYQAVFSVVLPGGTPSGLPYTRNAMGRSIIYGAEASAQASFDNWSFDFGAAYLYSKLGTFDNTENPFFGALAPDGSPLPANCDTGSPTVNLTGAKVPFAPTITGNVGVEHAVHIAEGLTLTPRADLAHIGKSRATLFQCEMTVLEARTLLNLQLRLEAEDGWYANAWMTNATDEHYVSGIQNDGALFTAGAPREFGIRVGKTF